MPSHVPVKVCYADLIVRPFCKSLLNRWYRPVKLETDLFNGQLRASTCCVSEWITMNLTGKLLIAMPGMGDPRFESAVVFLCTHSDEGAMGLIVNKPSSDVTLSELLEQLEITPETAGLKRPVHFGGPVEGGRGFVLHGCDYGSQIHTLQVTEDIGMTATIDVLEDIGRGAGPSQALMMLGYSGWGPGQLEGEIAQNGWLTTDASAELLFDTPDIKKWGAALKTLGIEPVTLSGSAGRA